MDKEQTPVFLMQAKKGLNFLDKLAKTAANGGRLFVVLAGSVDRRFQVAILAADVTRAGINAIKLATDGPKLFDLFDKEKKKHMREHVETAAIATFRILYVARTAGELANFITPMPKLAPLIAKIGLMMRTPSVIICGIGLLNAIQPLEKKRVVDRVADGISNGLDLTILLGGEFVSSEAFGPALGAASGAAGAIKAGLAFFR